MDIMGADFYNVVNMVHERLNANGVPIQLPIGAEDTFVGIIDLMNMDAEIYDDELGTKFHKDAIPADMQEKAEEYHQAMVEAICETDEALLEKFLSDEEISVDELKAALRKATINNEIVPMLCGTAYRNKGVQMLLDAVIEYMPSPVDVPAIKGVNPDTDEEDERPSSDDAPFAALAFKIATDPFVGKICFFRVYSGTLEKGSYVLNSCKGKRERMGRILQMHANHREDLDIVYSGDIAAAVGLQNTTTGETLCDEKHPIILESMDFPEPVIRVAIEPKTKAGQEKMGIALAKLAEEDPTFKTYTDEETGQTIIAGMGELTLKLSLTDFFVSLRLRLTLVNLRFLTERLSEKQLISNINMLVNQVVKVSTVTYFLNLSRLKRVQVMNSLMQSSAVLFLRNISLLLTQVSKVLCSLVYLQVTM